MRNIVIGLIFLAAARAAHAQSWTNYYDGGPNEVVFALALDGGGNVLVNGLSQGTGGYYHLTTIKYSNAGLPLWINNYDAPGNAYLEPAGVAVDGSGNPIATAAWFDNAGYRNFATIKYSSSGVPLWTNYYGHTAGGNDTPRPRSIAVDSAGNVFVAGDSESAPGNPESTDVVIIKYSGAGVPLWTNRFNGPANADDGVYGGLALDSAGNVIVACASAIGSRHEILKYSSAGALVWARYYHGPALTPLADAPYAIAVDAANNVFVAGDSARTVTIDGSPVTRADLVTIKYSAGGTPLWTNLYQGGLDEVSDWAKALALDANGNVLVTGVQDGGFIPADCVTIKYSGAGVPLWTNIYSGPSDRQRYPSAIAVNGVGDVFVTGRSAFEYPTIKYSAQGVPLWTNYVSCAPENPVLAVDGTGNAFVAGSSRDGANWDFMTIKYAAEVVRSPLNIQRLANNVVLSWTNAAFVLQAAPVITGTFTNVPGASSPYTNMISGGQGFFRLAQ